MAPPLLSFALGRREHVNDVRLVRKQQPPFVGYFESVSVAVCDLVALQQTGCTIRFWKFMAWYTPLLLGLVVRFLNVHGHVVRELLA